MTQPDAGSTGGSDRAARSARRAAARATHPDLGGDPDAFIEAMAAHPAAHPLGGPADGTDAVTTAPLHVVVTRRSRALRTISTTGKTLVADVRRRLPRSFPGSRRYGRL